MVLRLTAICLAVGAFPQVALTEEATKADFQKGGECTGKFRPPPNPPKLATHFNGLDLNDTCFYNETSEYDRLTLGNPVFLIGDWGGITGPGQPVPIPADHTNTHDPHKRRSLNWAVDRNAQQRVAGAFNARGKIRNPDYVINVGDNFYWAGVNCPCGRACWEHCETWQWRLVYERLYKGPGIDGVPWLSVLGNHDYGGWEFNKAWDQAIAYTWTGGPEYTKRWIQPAIYYKARVHYTGFDVDWFFVDSNNFDVKANPWFDPDHNICSAAHSGTAANCAASGGPQNVYVCAKWFSDLWSAQQSWLDGQLRKSNVDKVDWQFVVTHFPPWWGQPQWQWLASRYGIDIFITGHVHRQDITPQWIWWNQFKPSSVVITGGGGGITSEYYPNPAGYDDQYGFIDMTLWKDKVKLEAVSHGSIIRKTQWVKKREAQWQPNIQCATGTKVTIKSLDGKYLSSDSDNVISLSDSESDVEQWLLKKSENGKYLISSSYDFQLTDNNGAGVVMSDDNRTWQQWKVMDAGDGKVFLSSFRGQQIMDNNGALQLSWDKQDLQKWYVRTLDDDNACDADQTDGEGDEDDSSDKIPAFHVGQAEAAPTKARYLQENGMHQGGGDAQFDCEDGKSNWESDWSDMKKTFCAKMGVIDYDGAKGEPGIHV
eukprot:TRINITY_DN656_c0_g1_i1.p1 TRINITY_DN656_c0_g1~~TRINITY_DN656_c0_g1_i1.p1  ORF type:complete len:684 (+),score=125.93 TRINITY_DN656_c0_g1_i1:91-2052(+)